MATTWFITREREDAEAECATLRERGVTARVLPCVTSRLLPWPWPNAGDDTLTLFTSRRAVDAWRVGGQPPLGRVASTSPHTAELLRQLAVSVELQAEDGALGLARAIINARTPAHVRYPTSNLGLESAEQTAAVALLSAFPLERRVVYEVREPDELHESARDLLSGDYALTFASPSAVRHFLRAANTRPSPRHVVCFGTSTAQTWNRARPETWPTARLTRDLHATITEVNAP